MALFEDFEEIVGAAGVERLEAEVVEDEQIGAAQGFDEAWMAAVARASACSSQSFGQR